MKYLSALIPVLFVGCASQPVSKIRFADRPIATKLADTKHVPKAPKKSTFERAHNFFDTVFAQPVDRALAAKPTKPAQNINALGEVPDSSWFENRELEPQDVFLGPSGGDRFPKPPFQILSAKSGGVSVGYVVEDAAGERFILKFDEPEHPEMKTGANIVTQRLFWALGYNVPEDHVAMFLASDLRLPEPKDDEEQPELTQEILKEQLQKVHREDDGRIRGLFSHFIDGELLGGWMPYGTREGDPNDTIPHEHRREVRGLQSFFGWLEHTDAKEDNRLDVYVTDNGRSFVRHYFVDFDKALGVNAVSVPRIVDGFAYAIDFRYIFKTLPTLGLWARPWELAAPRPDFRGVGRFEGSQYTPKDWVGRFPVAAFDERTRYDDLWAAIRLSKITPDHIREAVRAAKYSESGAAEYITTILLERRRKILQHAFTEATPIANVEFNERSELCFDDMWLAHIDDDAPVRYRIQTFNDESQPVDPGRWFNAVDARTCAGLPASTQGYTIARIDVERGGQPLEPVEVHFIRDAAGTRLVGLLRAEEFKEP